MAYTTVDKMVQFLSIMYYYDCDIISFIKSHQTPLSFINWHESTMWLMVGHCP